MRIAFVCFLFLNWFWNANNIRSRSRISIKEIVFNHLNLIKMVINFNLNLEGLPYQF